MAVSCSSCSARTETKPTSLPEVTSARPFAVGKAFTRALLERSAEDALVRIHLRARQSSVAVVVDVVKRGDRNHDDRERGITHDVHRAVLGRHQMRMSRTREEETHTGNGNEHTSVAERPQMGTPFTQR